MDRTGFILAGTLMCILACTVLYYELGRPTLSEVEKQRGDALQMELTNFLIVADASPLWTYGLHKVKWDTFMHCSHYWVGFPPEATCLWCDLHRTWKGNHDDCYKHLDTLKEHHRKPSWM